MPPTAASRPDLLNEIRETISRFSLFTPGQTVLVAVSGGPDSVALLHALHRLGGDLGITLAAAHLDHGFRGAESASDADYVRTLCASLGIPCRTAFEDVPALKKRLHLSSQEAARRARHAFLREAAAEAGAERIALGHTRDDRAETVLMNIFRGTGPEGLVGFPAARFPIVRPLYLSARSETASYCERHGLRPRTDSSNSDPGYRRNWIRLVLLPQLEERFNPRIVDALLRLSDLSGSESLLVEEMAASALDQDGGANSKDGELLTSRSNFNARPRAVRRRELRRLIGSVRGALNDVDHESVERVLDAAERNEALTLYLPVRGAAPLRVRVTEDSISVAPQENEPTGAPWEAPLPETGRVLLPTGAEIEIHRCASPGEARALYREMCAAPDAMDGGPDALLLPERELRLPLTARSWRPGDRMRIRGMEGSKKVQDIFVDRKVPRGRRLLVPIITEREAAPAPAGAGGGQSTGRILGLLGVQPGESSLSLNSAADSQNIGACLLIMALSPRGAS